MSGCSAPSPQSVAGERLGVAGNALQAPLQSPDLLAVVRLRLLVVNLVLDAHIEFQFSAQCRDFRAHRLVQRT